MKLATRLTLAFALVATLPLAAVAPLVLREVRGAFEAELEHRLGAAVQAVEREQEALAAEVLRALEAVAGSEALRDAAFEPVAAGDAAALVGVAEELMGARGLDVLALLDDEGRVLSSGHLPARVGDPDPASLQLSQLHEGLAAARWVEVRDADGIGATLALVAARPVAWGAVRLHVVAGKRMGDGFAHRLAATSGSDVELLPVEGDEALASAVAPAPPVRHARLLGLLPAPGARERELPLPDAAGEAAARIRLQISDASLAAAQARIVGVLGLFLLASVGMASGLGFVLARRIVRPVEALAAGAAVVARGALGHRVEARAGGEVGALVEAFNRMSGDLQRERERAAVAERVAAWQEVARRLAHEIKNPLSPIAMSVETLRDAHRARNPLLDEIFEDSSRVVLEEVARLKRIVDEFSRFARLPPPEIEALGAAELAAPVVALYASQGELALERAFEADLPPVRADRDQILQVLLNLVQNAEQAMGGRGRVTLRARRCEAGVAFEVDDEGPGVPPEARERIFEPYVTGRASGTGLGLAIARRIAEEHGGSLEVGDAPGGGARFRLVLPAA